MYVYATERSESSLENFGIFTFLICYFFQYFVGTSDTLSVQMTCLSAHMYRQISKCTDKFPSVPTKIRKSIIGGAAAPPAPPLATLMVQLYPVTMTYLKILHKSSRMICMQQG